MNSFDIFIIIILGYSLVRGLFRGLVKEVSSIIGVFGGFYAAFRYYDHLAALLSGLISQTVYLNILSFLIIFCGVLILISILGIIIKYLMNVAFLGWVDRTFGILFGIVKGLLIVSVILLILATFLPAGAPLLKRSILAPHVMGVSERMANLISGELNHDYSAKLEEVKKQWKMQP
jgi:membrane protein required for colicin V production